VPRKVTVQQPQRRREGVNRAQLKALAARQAMTTAAVSTARTAEVEEELDDVTVGTPTAASGALPRGRRRVVLTREEEYGYIRRDLIRLAVIAAALLALMLVLLVVLR
jgi:hypothetical protein